MKSTVIVALVILALAAPLAAQWSGGTSDTASITHSGNVGIGMTATPPSVLTIQMSGPDSAGEKYLHVQNTSSFTGIRLNPGQSGDSNWLLMAGFPNVGDFSLREMNVATYFTVKKSSGYVGIGTSSPSALLDVHGSAHMSGDLVVDGNLAAKFQDVAEWVPADGDLPAGTVVTIDPDESNHVLPSRHAYDTTVAGVISPQPGLTLGERGNNKALVATTGRVRVRVDATTPISRGDLLVASDRPGVAMRSVPVDIGGVTIHRPGTVIGKALEPLPSGEGEILVLLALQ